MPNWAGAGQGAVAGAGAGAALGPWGAAGGAVIGGLGGLFSGDDQDEVMRRLAAINEQANALDSPDPAVRKRQLEALQLMWESAKAGGMDPQSKAALQQAQASSAAAERGARGAIVQNAQARGVGGSGVEFGAALANQQGAAQRNSMAGTAAAGDARTRALQAMYQTASGSGQARGQDLSAAQAKSQVEQFNARQRLQKGLAMTGQGNVDAQQNRQDIAGLGAGAGALIDYATRKKPAAGGGYSNGGMDNSTSGGWYD